MCIFKRVELDFARFTIYIPYTKYMHLYKASSIARYSVEERVKVTLRSDRRLKYHSNHSENSKIGRILFQKSQKKTNDLNVLHAQDPQHLARPNYWLQWVWDVRYNVSPDDEMNNNSIFFSFWSFDILLNLKNRTLHTQILHNDVIKLMFFDMLPNLNSTILSILKSVFAIEEDDVLKALESTNVNKGAGPDSFPSIFPPNH